MSTTSTTVIPEDFCQVWSLARGRVCPVIDWFLAVLDTTFTVRVSGEGGSEAGKDGFSVAINLSTNTYRFDRKLWRDIRHNGEGAINMGEPIRKQMALDFYVDG
jgi:hypothetical protein